MSKLLASFFGIGYMGKGGGTVAALAWTLIWFLVQLQGPNYAFQIVSLIVVTVLGIWTGNIVETDWGKDSSKVVIDEVAGVGLTLLYCPIKWYWVLIALLLFRIFDIAKPLGIRKTEALPKGWGVMADDLLSGVYGWIVLQFLLNVFFR